MLGKEEALCGGGMGELEQHLALDPLVWKEEQDLPLYPKKQIIV